MAIFKSKTFIIYFDSFEILSLRDFCFSEKSLRFSYNANSENISHHQYNRKTKVYNIKISTSLMSI